MILSSVIDNAGFNYGMMLFVMINKLEQQSDPPSLYVSQPYCMVPFNDINSTIFTISSINVLFLFLFLK